MEQEIIAPIDKEVLKQELTPERQLRMTNKSHNEIYIITAHNAPNVMKEIGRLREIAFREAGGGTGKAMDIDEFDTCENCYKQLIVWNPEAEEIIGGYRYLEGTKWDTDDKGQPRLATSHMFHFSEKFLRDYAPYTIELGRSFVALPYQSSRMGAKSLFALDNLWDGLGAIVHDNPQIHYLIGKVTIYPDYDPLSRDLLYAYLQRYCSYDTELFMPYQAVPISREAQQRADQLFEGESPTDNFHILQKAIRAQGTIVPPMFSAYLNLTPKLQYFGTSKEPTFSNVYDSGIMIELKDIYQDKIDRYIGPYINYLSNK
jgi:hypothetical protein